MKHYITALTIAGSDPSGGAGLQADVKTMSAFGVYAATAITAVTVQDTVGVTAVHELPDTVVADQIRTVVSDVRPKAVKIGMLGCTATAMAVADELARLRHVRLLDAPIVLDPVMVSTSGHRLIDDGTLEVLKQRLLPMAALVTPNRPEAELLAQMPIGTNDDAIAAARAIQQMGAAAVLVKGGHSEGAEKCDVLLTADGRVQTFSTPAVDTPNSHGTGCTLSSAIASCMAMGQELPDAVLNAKMYIQHALEAGADVRIGRGHGPVCHAFDPRPQRTATGVDFPPFGLQFITHQTPEVSYREGVERALAAGCRWVQFRMKGEPRPGDDKEALARDLMALCHACGATFLIDDDVELVGKIGADGVHLGKNDMPVDEARTMLGDGVIIGGTANTLDDVRRLAAAGADYIGCGPFRFTQTKKNLAPVLGLDGYRAIVAGMQRERLRLPVVAIGGITAEDVRDILATGVNGIAVSGALLHADDPAAFARTI